MYAFWSDFGDLAYFCIFGFRALENKPGGNEVGFEKYLKSLFYRRRIIPIRSIKAALGFTSKEHTNLSAILPHISVLYHGLNVITRLAQGGAQLLYVSVDGPVVALEIPAPDGVEDLVAR